MTFKTGHALLVGVGDFIHHPEMNVPITVDDARAVAKVLQDPEYCGYPKEQVQIISGALATKAGIERSILQIADVVDEHSTVFVFLCSHGVMDADDNWYFSPHDARYIDNHIALESGLGRDRLFELLRTIPAQRLIVVFNTCFSGNAQPTLAGNPQNQVQTSSPNKQTVDTLLATGKGRIILTAAGENQYSYFTKGSEITVFTESLVNALRAEDPVNIVNRNGFISIYDLYSSVYDNVKNRVQQFYNQQQEPEFTVLRGVGPFAISLYKGQPALLQDYLGQEQLPQVGNIREIDSSRIIQIGEKNINVSTGGGDFVGRDKINIDIRLLAIALTIIFALALGVYLSDRYGMLDLLFSPEVGLKTSVDGIAKPINAYTEISEENKVIIAIELQYTNFSQENKRIVRESAAELEIEDEKYLFEPFKDLSTLTLHDVSGCADFIGGYPLEECLGIPIRDRTLPPAQSHFYTIAFVSKDLVWEDFGELVQRSDSDLGAFVITSSVGSDTQARQVVTECQFELEKLRADQLEFQNDVYPRGLNFECKFDTSP